LDFSFGAMPMVLVMAVRPAFLFPYLMCATADAFLGRGFIKVVRVSASSFDPLAISREVVLSLVGHGRLPGC
jgi:hypothetical protein